MSKTSVWLPDEAERALAFLRSLPGGFNFSRWLRDALVELARKRGWRE